MGESKKWVLSIVLADLTPLVGGWVRKDQNHTDKIYEWSKMKQDRKTSRNQKIKGELSTILQKVRVSSY